MSGKPYRQVVLNCLSAHRPSSILDLACGAGWLARDLRGTTAVDGVDAYNRPGEDYRQSILADLNHGVPAKLPTYDAIVMCEAMAYILNPGSIIRSIREHMNPGGLLIVTDPNPLCVSARLNYLIQGFPRSHSGFVVNDRLQPHMPWLNLGLFQYWLLLGLNGFQHIQMHEVDEPKPRGIWEYPFGFAARLYYKSKCRKAGSDAERSLWHQAGSDQNLFGRRLVISATAR